MGSREKQLIMCMFARASHGLMSIHNMSHTSKTISLLLKLMELESFLFYSEEQVKYINFNFLYTINININIYTYVHI